MSLRIACLGCSGILLLAVGGVAYLLFPGFSHVEVEDLPVEQWYGERWGGGLFPPAKKARRIEHWRGKTTSAEDIGFLVCVPMSEQELQQQLESWKANPEEHFYRDESEIKQKPAYWPDWFPEPSKNNYVGAIRAQYHGYIMIYRIPNSDDLYLSIGDTH